MEEFMKLYETVYQDLYRVAYYYLGNGADAEDAVQDAVLAAWENFGKLRRKEAFRAWDLSDPGKCLQKKSAQAGAAGVSVRKSSAGGKC